MRWLHVIHFYQFIFVHAIRQVLLVTSSRNIDHWIVPGGGVDPGEEPAVTAVREVLEEAGVVGNLGRSLGVFEVILVDVTCGLSNHCPEIWIN